jgi:hypothetical protein
MLTLKEKVSLTHTHTHTHTLTHTQLADGNVEMCVRGEGGGGVG